MRREFSSDNQQQLETAKKSLVYIFMTSVVMLFGGFISAYIVSMGDSFWLKVPLPTPFWISTTLLVISSITLIVATTLIRKGNRNGLKLFMSITLILGIGFVYFQFKGYGELIDNGVYFTGSHIVVTDGKYGDYFEVKAGEDQYIEVNGNDYLLNGKKLTDEEMKEFQKFASQFLNVDVQKPLVVTEYGSPYKLMFHSAEMTVSGTKLLTKEGEELKRIDRERLMYFARNIVDGRGDFFVRGDMGKDFHVYYKGEELSYKDRELHLKNAKLSPYLQLKAIESADTASSFLYVITFAHLLHVIVTVCFLIWTVIRSYTGQINQENMLALKMTGVFWHFLGLLWLFLLLFLLFIH